MQVTYEKESGRTADELPKHGKIDPKNTPHVGGGTWAGGTGMYYNSSEPLHVTQTRHMYVEF